MVRTGNARNTGTADSKNLVQRCEYVALNGGRHDLQAARGALNKETLAARDPTVWRYCELRPVA